MAKKTPHTTKSRRTFIKHFRLTSRLAIQAAIIALVICGGVSAIVIQHTHSNTSKQQPATTSPASQPSTTEPVAVAPTQSTTPSTSAQGSSSKPTSSSSDGGPDADGCVIGSSGYQSCHQAAQQLKFTEQCDSSNDAAGNTFYAALQQAQAAYNTVMAEWNSVKDEPAQLHSPYSEYAADAQSKYNAISSPAYNVYIGIINGLRAQGCQIVQIWNDSDATWN